MADTTDAPVKIGGAYKESDSHVPNPTDMYDQFNTSGTGSHHVIEDISPVFEVASKQNAVNAARAIDPDDPAVPSSHVVFPDAQHLRVVDDEALKEQIRTRADAAKSEPAVVGGPTVSERAAQAEGDDAAAQAQAETTNQGAGGSNVGQARRDAEQTETNKGRARTADAKADDGKDDGKKA